MHSATVKIAITVIWNVQLYYGYQLQTLGRKCLHFHDSASNSSYAGGSKIPRNVGT